MLSVLVVGQDRFLGRLGDVLQDEGMRAVCVGEIDAAMEAVEQGFRPGAIVVDPATVLEPGGGELVRYLAGSPALAAVPVFSISGVMKRLDLAELVATLRECEQDRGAMGRSWPSSSVDDAE